MMENGEKKFPFNKDAYEICQVDPKEGGKAQYQLVEHYRLWTFNFPKSNITYCCPLIYRRACRIEPAIWLK